VASEHFPESISAARCCTGHHQLNLERFFEEKSSTALRETHLDFNAILSCCRFIDSLHPFAKTNSSARRQTQQKLTHSLNMVDITNAMEIDPKKTDVDADADSTHVTDTSSGTTQIHDAATIESHAQMKIIANISDEQESGTINDSAIGDGSNTVGTEAKGVDNASPTPRIENGAGSTTNDTQSKSDGDVIMEELNQDDDDDNHAKNPHLKTLNRIRKVLQNYEPNDELDQDTIVSTILKMNKSSYIRCSRKAVLNKSRQDFGHDEMCWDDDDLFHNEGKNDRPNYLHALVNVVDADFFYDIIANAEANTTDILLNEETIKLIRDSLGIHDDGKKRKRRDVRVAKLPTSVEGSRSHSLQDASDESGITVHPQNAAVDKDERSTSDGRPRTRGMTRGSRSKYIDEHKSIEHEGLEILLGAMTGLEKTAGRPINLLEGLKQTRRLNTRNKSQKQSIETIEEDRVMKLVDAKGRKVTKITVGGKTFVSPKRRGPKRKRISNDEVSCFCNLLNFWFVL
jgi:hypothetical protein